MKQIIFLIFLTLNLADLNAAELSHTYKIKWVLAHEPIGLFKEAASVFSEEVKLKTNGKISFEILTMSEYESKYNASKKITYPNFLHKLQDGSIEMSQTYTTDLGRLNNSLYVLDLPFLFRDHEHAKKVLEGKVGNNLLSSLTSSNIRGLAFTYSGGYRVIPGTKKISRVEDFKGMKIRTSSSPIAQETFNILGAKAVPMGLDEIENGIKTGKIDEAESTYARYFTLGQNQVAKIVNETNHSLFLTSIIINEKFWNSLPENYKIIVREAAIKAARIERDHSVLAGVETKKQCKENGIEVVTFDQKEEARFKRAVIPVYKKFSSMLGQDLISRIQNQ
jgi:tripartite ATP-independent transporter DctP family solute receptor